MTRIAATGTKTDSPPIHHLENTLNRIGDARQPSNKRIWIVQSCTDDIFGSFGASLYDQALTSDEISIIETMLTYDLPPSYLSMISDSVNLKCSPTKTRLWPPWRIFLQFAFFIPSLLVHELLNSF